MIDIDEIDRGILHLLQQNARDLTARDMAERLPVSEGTVRNRLAKLEDHGVIRGYVPIVDYEKAGFPLKIFFTCRAPIANREEIVERALDVEHVVSVWEMMAGDDNVKVVAIVSEIEEATNVAKALDELGLRVNQEQIVRQESIQPFDHFGSDIVEPE